MVGEGADKEKSGSYVWSKKCYTFSSTLEIQFMQPKACPPF